MKKGTTVFLLVLFSLLSIEAFSQHAKEWDQPEKGSAEEELHFSSSDFGFFTPLSVDLQYSKSLGSLISGKYTNQMSLNHAINFLAEIGESQYRFNTTWGYRFTPYQQVKLTGEYLTQNIDFDFYSGEVREWIGQYAWGFSYQYLIQNSFLHAVELNASYSKANSKTLSHVDYEGSDGFRYRNYRHIAGGINKNLNLAVSLHPVTNTALKLQLDYDSVHYPVLYISNQDEKGLGTTIKLDQLLSKTMKIGLSVSDRKPYQHYQAGFYWLYPAFQSVIEFGVIGDRIIGSGLLNNDSRFNFHLAWKDRIDSSLPSYSLNRLYQINSLEEWVSQPAVYRAMVFAIKDEKVELIQETSAHVDSRQNQSAKTIFVQANKELDINVEEYVTAPKEKQTYRVSGLPTPPLEYKEGKILGRFSSEEVGERYDLKVASDEVEKDDLDDDQEESNLVLHVVSNQNPPSPTSHHPEDPLYFTIGEENKKSYSALWLFSDEDAYQDTLELSVDGLPSDSGIKWNYYQDSEEEQKSRLVFSGNPSEEGEYRVSIKARNLWDPPGKWSEETQDFVLKVIHEELPKIDVSDQKFSIDGVVDETLATISLNKGSIERNIKIENVTPDISHRHDLSYYGVNVTIAYPDNQHAKVFLKGKVNNSTLHTQLFRITAQNGTGEKPLSSKTFRFNVSGPPQAFSLGSGSKGQGELFELDTASYFKNPTYSGSVYYYAFNGGEAEYLGLKINSATGKITGRINSEAQPKSGYQIRVHAKNNICNEFSNDAVYTLDVKEVGEPVINIPVQHFKVGKPVHIDCMDSQHSYIQAGSGEMGFVTSNVSHGLQFSVNSEKHIILSGKAQGVMSNEATFSINVENTKGKQSRGSFKLGIGDVPEKRSDVQETVFQGEQHFKYTETKNHFSNPVHYSELKYSFNNNDTSVSANKGRVKLNINEKTGEITGTVAKNARVRTYRFNIKAHNEFGISKSSKLQLTVKKHVPDYYYLTPNKGAKIVCGSDKRASLTLVASSDQKKYRPDTSQTFTFSTEQKGCYRFRFYAAMLEGGQLYLYYHSKKGKEKKSDLTLRSQGFGLPEGVKFVNGFSHVCKNSNPKKCQLQYPNPNKLD